MDFSGTHSNPGGTKDYDEHVENSVFVVKEEDFAQTYVEEYWAEREYDRLTSQNDVQNQPPIHVVARVESSSLTPHTNAKIRSWAEVVSESEVEADREPDTNLKNLMAEFINWRKDDHMFGTTSQPQADKQQFAPPQLAAPMVGSSTWYPSVCKSSEGDSNSGSADASNSVVRSDSDTTMSDPLEDFSEESDHDPDMDAIMESPSWPSDDSTDEDYVDHPLCKRS